MRMRSKPWAKEIITLHPNLCITNPENYKGNWSDKIFNNHNQLNVEVGSGKGDFIIALAGQNPQANYIAFEKNYTVLGILLKKLIASNLNNVILILDDARNLDNFFGTGEVSNVYLNFSDPWPKNRNQKRRLTSSDFLQKYEKILVKNGLLHLKTDNDQLFAFSVLELQKNQWTILDYTTDLHNSIVKDQASQVKTEYEIKFLAQGKNINYLLTHKLNI